MRWLDNERHRTWEIHFPNHGDWNQDWRFGNGERSDDGDPMRLNSLPLSKRVTAPAAFAIIVVLWVALGSNANAQALPTATGPGTYIALGGGLARFQSDYGKTTIRGYTFFMDVSPYWHSGLEVEARRSDYPHFGERQSTLLVGPRWSIRTGRLVPYSKLLMGGGQFSFPHGYGTGRYFV